MRTIVVQSSSRRSLGGWIELDLITAEKKYRWSDLEVPKKRHVEFALEWLEKHKPPSMPKRST